MEDKNVPEEDGDEQAEQDDGMTDGVVNNSTVFEYTVGEQAQETREIVTDYRVDVSEYMKENNDELSQLEEAVSGLLKAFRRQSDFYDGLRRLDARTDSGKYFLEYLTRFMGNHEDFGDEDYKTEVKNYIEANTSELHKIQESINHLLKAYKFADDFVYGIERLERETDFSKSFVENLKKFVEMGLSSE